MKDYSEKDLRDGRPKVTVSHAIGFCLKNLFADKSRTLSDSLTNTGLTYEEFIGALLLAEDLVKQVEDYEDDYGILS